jgi:hypothetical protein
MEAKGGIFMKNQFGLRKGNPARTCLIKGSAAALLVALLLLVCAVRQCRNHYSECLHMSGDLFLILLGHDSGR